MSERPFHKDDILSVAISEMLEGYGKQLTEEKMEKNNLTCYNNYFAISLDTYKKKEYIMYSVGDTVIEKERNLGEFLFDFSDVLQKRNRKNVVDEYLSYFPEVKKECLLTDKFIEIQRHISLDEMHKYSSFQIFEQLHLENILKSSNSYNMFYVGSQLYVATDFNLYGLFRYYLDEIYAAGLFPRRCLNCDRLFIANTNIFDVLCSDACRKQRNSEKLSRYKEKHNDECETQYMKVYQRWYTRIRRAKEKGRLSDGDLQICRDIFSDFTLESYEKRNGVRNGDVSSEVFKQWIDNFEKQMNMFFNCIQKNNSPGVKKG